MSSVKSMSTIVDGEFSGSSEPRKDSSPLVAHEDGLGYTQKSMCPFRFRLPNLLPHGSLQASGFNLASATLGAGTLALPSAVANSGALIGTLLLLLCCASTVYSIRLLVITLEKTGYMTYEEMAHKLVGPRFEKLTAFLIVAFCWGITIVYVVAIGDILDPLREVQGFPEALKGIWGRRAMMTMFWAVFMLPLSLAKEINSLRYASLIGMVSTGFLVSAIVTHAGEDKPVMANVPVARFDMDMMMSLTIFIFAYCCQTNSFEIYTEMTNRSVNRMTLAAGVSMSVCTCIYIVAGVAGSADFGKHTDSNILKNYKDPTNTAYITLAFVAISVTLTMAFPICIFPTRDAIIQMVGYKDAYSTPSHVRLFISGSLATSSILVGLFVPGIGVLFGLLGGICGSTLAFIWPALFIMRTGEWTVEKAGLLNVVATHALFYGGIVIGIVGTGISVYQQFGPKTD